MCKNLDRFQLMCKFGWLNLWSFWVANMWLSYSKHTKISKQLLFLLQNEVQGFRINFFFFSFFFVEKTDHSLPFVSVSVACTSYRTVHEKKWKSWGDESGIWTWASILQTSAITIGTFKSDTLLGRNCNKYKIKQHLETLLTILTMF